MLSAGLQQILFGSTFYPGATVALDFLAGKYRAPGINNYSADFASIPNLTVTRATPAVSYAQTTGGLLVPFAANVARITDQGLLVEEARTNLIQQSQTFSNATWVKGGTATATANTVTAPDGTLTGNTLTFSAAFDYLNSPAGVTTSGATYTLSAYFKTGTASLVQIQFGSADSNNAVQAKINTATGTIVNTSVTGTGVVAGSGAQLLGNGWVRAWISGSYTGVAGYALISNSSYGTGTVQAWGAQVELGAFPTSYIPTTSASVTRAADVVSIGGLTIPLSSSILVSATPLQSTTSGIVAQLDDGTANNRVGMQLLNGNQPRYFQVRGGSSEASGQGTVVTVGQSTTFALRMAANDFNAAQGGTLFGADTTVTTPTMTKLGIGERTDNSAEQPNAYIRKIVLYPTALSDAQLQALTT